MPPGDRSIGLALVPSGAYASFPRTVHVHTEGLAANKLTEVLTDLALWDTDRPGHILHSWEPLQI